MALHTAFFQILRYSKIISHSWSHSFYLSVFTRLIFSHILLSWAGGKKQPSLTEAIIEFNESEHDPCVQEAFQLGLLRLILVTMMLENCISSCVGSNPVDPSAGSGTEWDRLRTSMQHSLTRVRWDELCEPNLYTVACGSGFGGSLKDKTDFFIYSVIFPSLP